MVVGVTSLIGAVAAYRAGNVLLARGAAFGVVALGGAAVGAKASAHVPEPVLLACFAALMLLVAAVMAVRLRRARSRAHGSSRTRRRRWTTRSSRSVPTFACQCPRALKVLVTATVVGLLTGFLGVGGGFLVVPALLLALALPMEYAAGTSLVVITMTSAAALAVRAGAGVSPDWGWCWSSPPPRPPAPSPVLGSPAAPTPVGSQTAFTVLVLAVAVYTAARAFPRSCPS